MSSTLRQQHFKLRVDDLIRGRIRSVPHALRKPLERLICAVRSASKLLSHHQRLGSVESDPVESILGALIRMAQHAHAWIRSPEDWLVPAANPAIQFRSLVSHLFDRYPVPSFMPRVWLFNGRPWEIELYLHLAAGRSIRQFALPHSMKLLLTKKAAAWFMQADDDLEPLSAMRWAQIRSLGGDRNLARKLCTSTILKLPTRDEPFWESVVRFLVRHQPICVEDAISIVTFIQQQKFLPARTVLPDRNWESGMGAVPLQPDFTLRGRTLRWLRRHMANWIAEVGAKIQLPPIKANCDWASSGIAPIQVQLDDALWLVEELLNRESLVIEGGIMKHCVATYARECHKRYCSIWSMKKVAGGKRKRALTIEVSLVSRRIIQAKGVHNTPPSPEAEKILRFWASQERLRF